MGFLASFRISKAVTDLHGNCWETGGPFEGPEKLLEIWWQDSAEKVPTGQGLRTVKQADWEDMLDLVHCKVLSTIQGDGLDAYMLR